MPKKKRHHYIPKFYLKRFSTNSDGKHIGLYNHSNGKFVEQAPLKQQAYESFLYGEDPEIEDALAVMEDKVAKLFYYWTEEKLLYPPPPETNGFKLLKQFILFQSFRTPKSGDNVMESLNQGLRTLAKEIEPELWKQLKEGGRLVHENPVLLMLLNSIKHQKLLDFLDCRFLVNLSPLPLITSDAPVIFYNQLMEQAGNYVGATGLVAKGLQIFYPIHPRLMICLYDSKVYDFGGGCVNCCSTESIEEIHQLNGLQLINGKSQVFFDESISKEYVTELSDQFYEYRKTAKNINKVIGQKARKFMFMSSEYPHINLELDFFTLKVNPESFGGGLVPLRHPSLQPPRRNEDHFA